MWETGLEITTAGTAVANVLVQPGHLVGVVELFEGQLVE